MTDTEKLVEQCDREAAARWAKSNSRHHQTANIRRGSCDTAPIVQAFARHRIDVLTAAQQEIARLREALGQIDSYVSHGKMGDWSIALTEIRNRARKALEPSGETR